MVDSLATREDKADKSTESKQACQERDCCSSGLTFEHVIYRALLIVNQSTILS